MNNGIADGVLNSWVRRLIDATPNRLSVEISLRREDLHRWHTRCPGFGTPAGAVLLVER